MEKLKIDELEGMGRLVTMKVTGFAEDELRELKSMEHGEAVEKVLEMLDSRNNGTGTRWGCGYGIYGVWFDEEAVYLNIGKSAD